MTIGDRIKVVRKNEGLNQIEFAKRINVSQGRLSEIETVNVPESASPSLRSVCASVVYRPCTLVWSLTIQSAHLHQSRKFLLLKAGTSYFHSG